MDFVSCVTSFLRNLSGNYHSNPLFGSSRDLAVELLGMFLLFGLGLKVLNFRWFGFLRNSMAKSGVSGNGICAKAIEDDCDGENSNQCEEEKVFDVMSLRELVKKERRRADSAALELERERNSAAIAAEESMAMILRLQHEKSVIEMESNQYKRMAEEKMIYDQELIQSLQWLVMKDESERTSMGDEESFFTPQQYHGKFESATKRCLMRSLDLAIST